MSGFSEAHVRAFEVQREFCLGICEVISPRYLARLSGEHTAPTLPFHRHAEQDAIVHEVLAGVRGASGDGDGGT